MAKQSGNKVSIESWNIKNGKDTVTVSKIAVRASNGQFHGATNFRGSVLGK